MTESLYEVVHQPMIDLSLRSIDVSFGEHHILKRVSANLYSGELCVLLGPSGAGKSTLFKVILGLVEPDSGAVRIDSKKPGDFGVIGYVPQDDALHRSLNVERAITYAAQLRLPELNSADIAAKVNSVIQSVGLEERKDVRISRLSGGQRKRVSVALELLSHPEVLILDEPTSGLDPGLEAQMMRLFQQLAKDGRIVLLSSHAMESLDLCDSMLMMVAGHVAYYGPPAEALRFFRVTDYPDIFSQLPKQNGAAWNRTYLADPFSQRVLNRSAPRLAASNHQENEVGDPAPSSKHLPAQEGQLNSIHHHPHEDQPLQASQQTNDGTNSPPPERSSEEPNLDASLAELKKRMGQDQ